MVDIPAMFPWSYTPSNWYWQVGNDTSQFWSSKRAGFVPADDAEFLDWLGDDNQGGNLRRPTVIANQGELFQTLLKQYPAGTPVGQLLQLMNGVLWIDCPDNPALNGVYNISETYRTNMIGISTSINAGLGLPGGEATFNYPDASGQPHPWPADKFIAFAKAVMDFIYAVTQNAGGNPLPIPAQPVIIP